MGRCVPRRRQAWPPEPDLRWKVTRDRTGRWQLVDRSERDPLADADPLRQLEACYLAAAAPDLRIMLKELLRRFRNAQMEGRIGPDRRDEQLAIACEAALGGSRPPLQFYEEAADKSRRGEIELDFKKKVNDSSPERVA